MSLCGGAKMIFFVWNLQCVICFFPRPICRFYIFIFFFSVCVDKASDTIYYNKIHTFAKILNEKKIDWNSKWDWSKISIERFELVTFKINNILAEFNFKCVFSWFSSNLFLIKCRLKFCNLHECLSLLASVLLLRRIKT